MIQIFISETNLLPLAVPISRLPRVSNCKMNIGVRPLSQLELDCEIAK
jgi:hypothetical protein